MFVDIWGSPAGLLEVQAEANGQHAEMGDALTVGNKTHVRLLVHVAGVPADAVVAWAGDGAKLMTAGMKPARGTASRQGPAGAGGLGGGASTTAAAGSDAAPAAAGGSSGDMHRTFDLIADGHRHWLRADVRSADGKLLLLGNPIYLLGK